MLQTDRTPPRSHTDNDPKSAAKAVRALNSTQQNRFSGNKDKTEGRIEQTATENGSVEELAKRLQRRKPEFIEDRGLRTCADDLCSKRHHIYIVFSSASSLSTPFWVCVWALHCLFDINNKKLIHTWTSQHNKKAPRQTPPSLLFSSVTG